jgi:hypothetical protein
MASLAAVRASNFTAERDAIIKHYSPLGQLPLGDQDVLNIYGHHHPEQIYVMPCVFNFRCVHPPVVLERGPDRFYGLCAPLKMPSLEAWPVFGSMSIAWCRSLMGSGLRKRALSG